MATNSVLLKIDGELLVHSFEEVREQLGGAVGEIVLDFSSVRRVDPSAVRALEELAGAAHDKGVKLVLRGVNIEIYKVLKLMSLTPRFTFQT